GPVRDDAGVARAHRRPIGRRVAERDRAGRSRAPREAPADGLVAKARALDDHVDAGRTARAGLGSEEIGRADDLRDDRDAGRQGAPLARARSRGRWARALFLRTSEAGGGGAWCCLFPCPGSTAPPAQRGARGLCQRAPGAAPATDGLGTAATARIAKRRILR